jgi:hypothetical protein
MSDEAISNYWQEIASLNPLAMTAEGLEMLRQAQHDKRQMLRHTF